MCPHLIHRLSDLLLNTNKKIKNCTIEIRKSFYEAKIKMLFFVDFSIKIAKLDICNKLNYSGFIIGNPPNDVPQKLILS